MTDNRPESVFQKHIARYLEKQQGYTVLEAEEISDKDFYLVEPVLLGFLKATQADTLKALEANYGSGAFTEIISVLKSTVAYKPLWLIMREGLTVDNHHFQLFYPVPRSSRGVSHKYWQENRFQLKTELLIGENKRPDIVLFLNGLPIVVIELKHEKAGQSVHDAVTQFNNRNHDDKIFQLPFLYVAMDTSEVKLATNPREEAYFLWHNAGLVNEPQTEGEYPVEYFYRDVLAKNNLLAALSFYLIYVPPVDDKAAYSLFPRYHQSRLVNNLSTDIAIYFKTTNEVGKKYLVNHSAGSGKTLTISWLAERLHSLYQVNTKLFDIVFIITDRKDLDKNVQDDLDCFAHLSEQLVYAKHSAELGEAILQKQSIIVTTIQKFQYASKVLNEEDSLRNIRVAFLIDEAHRSQEGKGGRAIRYPFKQDVKIEAAEHKHEVKEGRLANTLPLPSIEQASDSIEDIKQIVRAYMPNQLFVAFTATPVKTTVQLFGEPFDTYSESEAIAEGYILDVAAHIISYDTLYNLHSSLVPSDDDKLYPKGIVSRLLKQVAFEDEALIQYKSEVILRTFEEQIEAMIDNKAKAMVVTSSRIAGLLYFKILQNKIAEKHKAEPDKYNYKVLYAFSDFTHRDTNEEIKEKAINGLEKKEKIEDRFKQDDYRILVVASKFQTGFNEPLLAGMFLDKPVLDKNAVQTLSRLNRCYEGKKKVVVLDFTNNTANIIKAFNKYRQGTPYQASEPDEKKVTRLYNEIIALGLFTDTDASQFMALLKESDDAKTQAMVNNCRKHLNFYYETVVERKDYVYQLAKLIKAFNFLSNFYNYSEDIEQFVFFSEVIGLQLIKEDSESELMKEISKVLLSKGAVKFLGEMDFKPERIKKLSGKGGNPVPTPPPKTTVDIAIADIKERYSISDEEALIIREVCEEKQQDKALLADIISNKDRPLFLSDTLKPRIRASIKKAYEDREHFNEVYEDKYIDDGAIFDMMANSVLDFGKSAAG